MTWEWKIGDPVDDSNGGTMDAMNWGHGSDDEEMTIVQKVMVVIAVMEDSNHNLAVNKGTGEG